MAAHPFLDSDGPIAFAHRGGAGVHPENSMAAFAHAVELGFTHLETDVHATADGLAVAFHDAELDRVTDSEGRVSDLDWSRVNRARIAGRLVSGEEGKWSVTVVRVPSSSGCLNRSTWAASGSVAKDSRVSSLSMSTCSC